MFIEEKSKILFFAIYSLNGIVEIRDFYKRENNISRKHFPYNYATA